MAINRLTTSFATGINENTLALANLNFDFSLLRVEAPAEYSSLGAVLTTKRRITAEEGTAHQTARRLGVLFQELLPSTPELLRAYGKRASEICQQSPNAEDGSGKHGIFAGFLGADITSVWAAATSGASSIAVHLLACLLARLWSGPEATSIWVEIVSERKRVIQERAEDGVYHTSIELSVICRQEITRSDLAQWDASARAWLQIGDDNQMRRQKQLMLILNNIHLPVNTGGSTFDRVIDAWLTAMNAMERLIRGQPQRAAKGAALMGLASWHLYPDILVLGETISSVKFDDTAISGSAQLTVGLENLSSEDHDGIYWSLSLSHLRFYGDPVVAKTYTSRDASRINIDELHLLSLGATLAGWGNFGFDPHSGARFFRAVGNACVDLSKNRKLTWLKGLVRASRMLLQSVDEDRNNANAIVALGRRKGRQFLADKWNYPPPLLGLNHPFTYSLLSGAVRDPPLDKELYMLHFIASHLGLKPTQLIIRIARCASSREEDSGSQTMHQFFEYRTAIPHVSCLYEGMTPSHIRWIERYYDDPESDLELGTKEASTGCKCHFRFHNCHHPICVCIQRGVTCTPHCHKVVDQISKNTECSGCQRQDAVKTESLRLQRVSLRCANMPTSGIKYRPEKGLFHDLPLETALRLPDWGIGITRPTREFSTTPILAIRHNPSKGPLCTCFGSASVFTLLAGDPNTIAMFIRIDSGVRSGRLKLSQDLAAAAAMPMIPLDTVIDHLESNAISPRHLTDFLESFEMPGVISLPSFSKDLHPRAINVKPFVLSLNALALATDMYQDFPGATISLGVIERPLHKAHWVPKDETFWCRMDRNFERRQRFACIAFFESGSHDLRPSDLSEVIALSLRNSIYVSSTLLGDPYELSHKDRVALVVGNVGKTGVVMMVAPLAPRVRPSHVSEWRQISHALFQGNAENCFRATSLHLSFTEFEMPFAVGQRGSIDNDIAIVETLISIHDRGRWVGDIDVLSLYEEFLTRNQHLRRFSGYAHDVLGSNCNHRKDFCPPQRLTALDNWEEILDLPEDLGKEHLGVVRAQDNWLARLATACIAIQLSVRAVIVPNKPVCWTCCCLQRWDWRAVELEKTAATDSISAQEQHQSFPGNRTVHKTNEAYDFDRSPTGDRGCRKSAEWETSHQSLHQEPQPIDSTGSQNPANQFSVLEESEYDSDGSVQTIEYSEEVENLSNAQPQLFIY